MFLVKHLVWESVKITLLSVFSDHRLVQQVERKDRVGTGVIEQYTVPLS